MAQVQQRVEKVMNDIHIANVISQLQYNGSNNSQQMVDIETNSISDSNESSIIPSDYQKVIMSENSNDSKVHFKSQRLQQQKSNDDEEKKEVVNPNNIISIDNVKNKRNHYSYYDIEYLKNKALDMMRNNGYSFETAFKCPLNHSLYTYPYGFGQCSKCGTNLDNNPCRHCKICNYVICLQCYKVSASNCPDYHGLVQYSPMSRNDFFCDVCGLEIPKDDDMHSCRKCDYDVCSKCYIPRTVLNNIDLNNIPLEPHKYDEIYLKNANRHRRNLHDMNHSNNDNDDQDQKSIEAQDKEIINDIQFIKFDFMEFQDIKSDYNLDDEEDYIDRVVSEIDKINDEVMDLEEEIRKKRILMDKLRKIELNKRTQLSEVKIWISQNKLLWESFKLRWKEWNIDCFIEFLKRVELKCCSFNVYYNGKDENCKIKLQKYMSDNTEKFNGSTVFIGYQHLPLLNELSLYRIGITNDKDCSIIYEHIQKLIKFDKKAHHHHKKRHKKSSKKKKKSSKKRKSHRKKKKNHFDAMDNDNKDHSAYESYEDESDKSNEHTHDNTLYAFLKDIKLERYYVTLCEDGFDDIECLFELNKEDLINLGMKNGHCKKLLKSIKMFSEKQERHSVKSSKSQISQIEGQHFYVSPK